MALSANAKVDGRITNKPKASIQVVNAATIYSGAAVALCGPTHGTAASQGRIKPWATLAGEIPFGWKILDSVLGVTSPAAGTPIPEGELDLSSRFLQDIAVAAITGDRTDVGKLVYMSDDNTFTVTRPAVGIPMGMITRSRSATRCDVYMFSAETMVAIGLSGNAKYTWFIGMMSAGAGTGNVATGIVAPHHGRISAVYGIVTVDATDADVQQTINFEIGGVDVTGGVITWLFSDTLGTKKAGTAITAANVFHEGDLIDIETMATVAGTTADPGLMALYATVEVLPGL